MGIRDVALRGTIFSTYNEKIEARMSNSPFLLMEQSCDKMLRWTKEQLIRVGLRPVQTFNLHTVRASAHDCSCEHHGTSECDCQVIILLIYGKAGEPMTLMLHGNNGQTWLSIADTPAPEPNAGLVTSIR